MRKFSREASRSLSSPGVGNHCALVIITERHAILSLFIAHESNFPRCVVCMVLVCDGRENRLTLLFISSMSPEARTHRRPRAMWNADLRSLLELSWCTLGGGSAVAIATWDFGEIAVNKAADCLLEGKVN